MDYRQLGRFGLKVSPLCLGTMMFGGATDAATAARIVARAREQGVNFIDTADGYNRGLSEEVVGSCIGNNRSWWVLATKCANRTGEGPNASGLSRAVCLHAFQGFVDLGNRLLQTGGLRHGLHGRDRRTPGLQKVLFHHGEHVSHLLPGLLLAGDGIGRGGLRLAELALSFVRFSGCLLGVKFGGYASEVVAQNCAKQRQAVKKSVFVRRKYVGGDIGMIKSAPKHIQRNTCDP